MAIYKNISTEATTTLIEKGKQVSGGISKILISNNHATAVCNVSVFFYDSAGATASYYIVKALSVPATVSLVLGDNLAFNADTYDLKIVTADPGGTSVDLSVTIK
jgi:hypothetical protein